jgi:hypothetical protein
VKQRGARTCSRTARRATIGAGLAMHAAVATRLPAQEPVASAGSAGAARDGAPPAGPPRAPVRLVFVGDVNLGTVTFPDGIPSDSARSLLDSARSVLQGDLVVIDCEGVLADAGAALKCLARPARVRRGAGGRRRTQPPVLRPNSFALRGPAALAQALRATGVTHANLADDHALDFGDAGLAATIADLESAGIRTYGPAARLAIDTVAGPDGARTIVGLIGFTTYDVAPDLRDVAASAALVDSLRPRVDLLIATFHGGAEGARAARPGRTGVPWPRADCLQSGQLRDVPRLQHPRHHGHHGRPAGRLRGRRFALEGRAHTFPADVGRPTRARCDGRGHPAGARPLAGGLRRDGGGTAGRRHPRAARSTG